MYGTGNSSGSARGAARRSTGPTPYATSQPFAAGDGEAPPSGRDGQSESSHRSTGEANRYQTGDNQHSAEQHSELPERHSAVGGRIGQLSQSVGHEPQAESAAHARLR